MAPRTSTPAFALLALACAAACGAASDPRRASPAPSSSVAGPAPPPVAILPPRRLRRLSSREYDNVVRDLLGDDTRPATAFVEDAYANGYDNGSAALAVQSDQAADYQKSAEALAAAAIARGVGALVGCEPTVAGPAACRDAFLDGLAARAFRRPLSQGERQRLRDVFDGQRVTLAPEGEGDAAKTPITDAFVPGLRAMLEVVLQSPQFLYREELGPIDDGTGTVALGPYELASELSFLLTGSLPDDTLWAAARDGRLSSKDDLGREAARLLATPAAREAMRAFLHRWLATDRTAKLTKDAARYPAFDATLAASMASELDRFYDDVLWESDGSLRALFTSTRSFADPGLRSLYGLSPGGEALEAVELDPSLRRGVMTRAGFLAVHAATDGSGPIGRGVFVLGAILCLPPPPPPPDVPPAPPAGDVATASLTTRERFAQHVASPTCLGCHRRIDGVGFGFEEFDGIGAFRATENGKPIDASGALYGGGPIDGPFDGVSELSDRLAESDRLRACYVEQAYRYAMGAGVPEGDALGWLAGDFTTRARMTDVFVALVTSPAFTQRRFERLTKRNYDERSLPKADPPGARGHSPHPAARALAPRRQREAPEAARDRDAEQRNPTSTLLAEGRQFGFTDPRPPLRRSEDARRERSSEEDDPREGRLAHPRKALFAHEHHRP